MATLIVGASVAGIRTAQSLRMRGYSEPITIIGDEPHSPYDKPPISKEMLARDGGAPVPLLTGDQLAELDVDLRLGVRADALDLESRTVTSSAGELFGYDDLVIATGLRPRTLPGAERLSGVYTLRNADDAAAVRADLMVATDVVVIGAGFIGAEFACAARAHGAAVAVVEPQSVPMAHLLGAVVGAELTRLHELNGVDMHTGVGVAGFVGDAVVTGVVLTDGRTLPADLVVVGIGASPATDWLESSDLPVDDGVVCDEGLRVIGAERVYAAGDIARWPNAHAAEPIRIEHWTNANEHGALAASSIMGVEAPRAQPPYVWSDQYGHRIQIVGRPAAGDAALVFGAVDGEPFTAIYATPDGRVVGALVVDDPRTLMKCRKAIAAGSVVDDLGIGVRAPI